MNKTRKKKHANEWNIDPKHVGYDKKHDSYYDRRDGRWLDKRCPARDCPFCSNRPLRAKIPT